MTQEPTFDELRAAIATALQNASFTHSGPPPARARTPVTADQIAELARQLPQPSLMYFMDRVEVALSAAGEAGLARLLRQSGTLDQYFDEQKQYLHVIGAYGVSLSVAMPIARACAKIVKSALLHSADGAARALAAFLDTGTFPVRTVHFVKGPTVPNPIDLDVNCRLVPYSKVVEIAGRAIADSPDNRIPLDPGTAGCGLVITTALRPGTVADLRPGAVEKRVRLEYESIAKFGPDFICAMLGVVTRRALYPFCHVEIVEDIYSDTLPMNEGRGGYSAENVEFSIFANEDQLTKIDRAEFVSLVTDFAEASDSVRRHLMIPLARLRMALTRREYVDRCIDLCVALEALVGNWHLKGFSERVAWVYSRVLGDYDGTRSTVKSFHRHRGRIVHAQPFSEKPELVEAATSILIECIKWIVQNRRIPDWETELV